MEKKSLIIQNLKCGGCANTIIKNIAKIEGVSQVSINQEESSISFLSTNMNIDKTVKIKLKTLGYPVIDEENSIVNKAKSFISCAKGRVASN